MILSWYHTLLFRQYPGYCTDGISARNQTLHRTIKLRSSSPPRSPRSGAMSNRYSQRRLSKNEVTTDCYSEKRSRPSSWPGSAPTGARAWGGPPVEYKRQAKNRFFRAGNLGYTNMRSPLSSTHRSFRLQFARRMGAQKDTLQRRHSYCWASDPFRFYIYYRVWSHSSLSERQSRPSYEPAFLPGGRPPLLFIYLFIYLFSLRFRHVCVST